MENSELNARHWLSEEFKRKKEVNSKYSLRSFAKQLNVSPARLSQYLSGKKPITVRAAQLISKSLKYSSDVEKIFFKLVQSQNKPEESVEDFLEFSVDSFRLISDWYYLAILNLVKLESFEDDIGWISQRLGISTCVAREALKRLFRLNLLEYEDGKLTRTNAQIKTTTDIESQALKISHKQSLNQAIEKIDEVPIELRDVTSVTMAINTKNILKAKKLAAKFRKDMTKLLEDKDADEVYNLNIQLVPVTNTIMEDI